jgi:hypothetical protein
LGPKHAQRMGLGSDVGSVTADGAVRAHAWGRWGGSGGGGHATAPAAPRGRRRSRDGGPQDGADQQLHPAGARGHRSKVSGCSYDKRT